MIKYFRFGWSYYYFRLSIVVEMAVLVLASDDFDRFTLIGKQRLRFGEFLVDIVRFIN